MNGIKFIALGTISTIPRRTVVTLINIRVSEISYFWDAIRNLLAVAGMVYLANERSTNLRLSNLNKNKTTLNKIS
jgi:hypothetical protein